MRNCNMMDVRIRKLGAILIALKLFWLIRPVFIRLRIPVCLGEALRQIVLD
jgi:hypothetical protein